MTVMRGKSNDRLCDIYMKNHIDITNFASHSIGMINVFQKNKNMCDIYHIYICLYSCHIIHAILLTSKGMVFKIDDLKEPW